jgi:hypothetical protein
MSDYDESTTIDNLIKHLQKEIAVDVEVEENESSDSKTPVRVLFIVKNTRDPDNLPNIVFKDISLVIVIPPDMNTINIPKLAPGESHVYEHLCNYSELSIIQYDIKANVSPESLFQFETKLTKISPENRWIAPITAYKKMIAELDIHKWLAIIPEVTIIPEPDTTLSQLKEQEDKLSTLIKELAKTVQQVDDFSRFQDMSLRNPKREYIIKHRNMVMDYLKQVERGIGELSRLYSSKPDSSMIEATKNRIVSKLSTLLHIIDGATERLVD